MGYEKIIFTSQIDEACSFDREISLYNKPGHLALLDQEIRSFYIVHQPAKKIWGVIHFSAVGDDAVSLPRRPFGSFELSKKINIEILYAFIDYVRDELKNQGFRNMIVKGFASIYGPDNFAKITAALYHKGFAASAVDVNYHLNIPEGAAFTDIIESGQRKRLGSCRKAGYRFYWNDHSEVSEIHDFIVRSRNEKQYPVTIDPDQLQKSISAFPEAYRLCTVRRAKELAAAGILVRVNERIVYDFMHASLMKFNRYSPTVMLVNGMFEYCATMGYKVLDLGVTSVSNRLQAGIAKFKENIGGIPTVKLTFEKKLVNKNALT